MLVLVCQLLNSHILYLERGGGGGGVGGFEGLSIMTYDLYQEPIKFDGLLPILGDAGQRCTSFGIDHTLFFFFFFFQLLRVADERRNI